MRRVELHNGLPTRHEVFIGWKNPSFLKVKINMHGTTKGNSGLAGAGYILRDSQ